MDSAKLLNTHEHPLTLVAGQSQCKACNLHTKSDHYYHCYSCKKEDFSFHKECLTYSPEINHPYHPRHTLQFCTRKYSEYFETCFWCNGYMGLAFYRCSICNLNIHLFCASQQQLVSTLDAGKKHDHPLTIFPRRMYFTCNLCGYFKDWYPIYACVQCDYMVHRECLSLPNVIRISCHEHRISRRLHLPPGEWLCGVCHLQVDPKNGAFFCTRDCGYAAHTICATSKSTVWDGKELEDVPEDVDELKDVEPFEVIDVNHIKHFSHDHNLRFVLNQDGDKTSCCQACNLLIHFDNFYTCEHCYFILHKECANFRRMRWHPLHRHPLTLKSDDMTVHIGHSARRGFYFCSMCRRFSCGFRYVCEDEFPPFEVDVLCASMPQQINHKNHPHLLFVNLITTNIRACGSCRKATKFVFYCLQCPDYTMCLECATLPDKVVYKHDKHPLILCCGEDEEEEGQHWCETCERKIDPKQWFYKCDDCCVTLHIPCLLGTTSLYAKPGPIMIKASRPGEKLDENYNPPPGLNFEVMPIRPEEEFEIIPNETLSRPLCCHCRRRCQDSVAFKQKQDFYCSLDCLCKRKSYDDPDILS